MKKGNTGVPVCSSLFEISLVIYRCCAAAVPLLEYYMGVFVHVSEEVWVGIVHLVALRMIRPDEHSRTRTGAPLLAVTKI